MAPGNGERSSGPCSQRFPRKARIRRGAEIRALFRRGRHVRTRSLDVYVLRTGAPRARLGCVVPKLGHRTTARNLVKRRLKEIGRRRLLGALEALGRPADVLVRARRKAYAATYPQLEREFVKAVEEACLPTR